LDSNQKQMKNCDLAIARLEHENKQKEIEIKRKERIKEILRMKAERIAKQRNAVQKYQEFLEDVRNNNSDQYSSISMIIDRHETLSRLQKRLQEELNEKETKLKTMKSDFAKYETKMNNDQMTLNNTLAQLKIKSENIDDEKNKLKSQEQENSSAQFEKITQLSKILMAIDHLEGFCKYKKLQYNRADNVQGLNYDAINLQNDEVRKADFRAISQTYFDSYHDRTEYAKSQIQIIGQYLKDFAQVKEIVNSGGVAAFQ